MRVVMNLRARNALNDDLHTQNFTMRFLYKLTFVLVDPCLQLRMKLTVFSLIANRTKSMRLRK